MPRISARRAGLAWLATALLAAGLASAPAATAAPTAAAAPAVPAAPPNGVLFDDFHYTGPDDPALAAHGWTVRTGTGGPGPAAKWDAAAVSFPSDPTAPGGQALQLRATTDGTVDGTRQAQINTAQSKFYAGTYAARVHFTDQATVGDGSTDHPVQSFYSISPFHQNLPNAETPQYSELDHEYLPHGGWDQANPGASYNTTAYHGSGDDNNVHTGRSLQGWHTLQTTVWNGTTTFYLDGSVYSTAPARYSPREPMNIDFNAWFIDLNSTGHARSWDERIAWVYYNDSAALSPSDVTTATNGLLDSQTHFVDTVPKPTAPNDHTGDGISDISLFYDHGPSDPVAGCPQSGAEHTSVFGLAALPDYTGALGGLTNRSDDPCGLGRPKFTASGDFDGDGKADLAAFYDFGTVGASCTDGSHTVIVEWPAGKPARTAWESTCFGSGTKAFTAGDFRGNGRSDLALLYDYGAGHVRLLTLASDPAGGFGGLVPQWDASGWGTGAKFLTAGDYNGDGKTDLAFFTDYGSVGATCTGGHQAVHTFTADPSGSGTFRAPVKAWESTCFGGGTTAVVSGDFNGDTKSDLALLYDHGAGHLSLLTLTADPGGSATFVSGLVPRWETFGWTTGTRFLTAGDYNGDGKTDLALFTDYGSVGATCTGGHQAVHTFTADPYGTGALQPPVKAWESTCFGGGTAFLN
ncbi:FG-GAP-like repeat-containing protein [Streptomyces sp. FH025]|uniref:FG-GAP-like repeat-containing protein n=1 Tax=Streptomyces sp. FH025 TaxID=2815937 RepID=UPI001A9E0607|nr:FG-GAP-like repeat-containing protein [Streptomyces sp. FH025]MBO1413981.1 VCBS repeat-containing protein [Streptomyces sp. FH025]